MDAGRRGFAFGSYVVDPVRRLVWDDGKLLPVTGKAFELLVFLVDHRDRVIEKDELLKAIWPDTFVQENNLVRHISTLRKSLGQHADQHDCILTVQGRGYRFVADVTELDTISAGLPTTETGQPPAPSVNGATDSSDAADDGASRPLTDGGPASGSNHFGSVAVEMANGNLRPLPRTRSTAGKWSLAGGFAAVAGAAILSTLVWVAHRSPATSSPPIVRQVTYGPATSIQPTWSPDGRSIAYASDRAGNFDIWVERLDGSEPIQVTSSPVEEWQPAWSPDGQWLSYRSEQGGGALFIVSLNGGMTRQVTDGGYQPRWSPDGTRLLYSSSMVLRRPRPKFFVIGVDGGAAQQLPLPESGGNSSTTIAAWTPDGRISMWGAQQDQWSFLTAAADGRDVTHFAIADDLGRQLHDLALQATSFTWSRDGRSLILEGVSHDVSSLWRVPIDAAHSRVGTPLERLTTGAGSDRDVALSLDGSQIAYSAKSESTRIWSFPLEANGRIAGSGVPVTPGGSGEYDAAVSADGQKLIYRTTRDSRQELWERSLQDGRERRLISGDEGRRTSPRWSPDGTRIAYQLHAREPRSDGALVVFALNEMREEVLTPPGAPSLIPDDWSRDGSLILGPCVDPKSSTLAACVAPAATPANVRPLVSTPYNLRMLRFSPDQRWISGYAFGRSGSQQTSGIVVIPAAGGQITQITDGTQFDQKPVWGTDSRTIYFISTRDGFFNVWGRHFDPQTGSGLGEPFRVTAFNSPRQMIAPDLDRLEIAVAAQHLYVPLTEATGQILILQNPAR